MAEALPSSFEDWIRTLLNDLQQNNTDMSDIVQYLLGIVTSDSETDEEKQVAIVELLADLDLKHDHDIEKLSQQILDRWNQSQNDNAEQKNSIAKPVAANTDDDVINTVLINAMNQMESTSKQHKSYIDHNSNKLNDDAASKKHKSQVLAKYSEVSDEEFDYGNDSETAGNGIFHNTNSQDIEDREKQSREMQQEVHKQKQEKNKVDAVNQKQKDEDRKKKAQQRAQKQERRR
ncbi:unnamed protein product [Adineta steineri]|uniref:Coiled-coil domain-containing protein 43 n=1 Tax=Adineta steineri TaxID=433720 RepID=A0A819KD76_9BILA|nr:unnamed protein product [Adineta steineri]CAF3947101.1 unnamed protein product [Adineta steineri]